MVEDEPETEDETAIDPRVVDDRKITWTRNRRKAHALVSTLPSDLYPTEQECLDEVVERHIEHHRRGTTPEQIFRQFFDLVEAADGALPVQIVGSDLVAMGVEQDRGVRLGLDERGWMRVEEETRDPEELAATEPEELSRSELVAEVERLREQVEDENE